jgi:hypothetical protein
LDKKDILEDLDKTIQQNKSITDQQKNKIAMEFYSNLIQDSVAKRALQPFCHSLYHPYLGDGVFLDTCPECGFKAKE